MLMALEYILNNITKAESKRIFPYIHKLAHLALRTQQLRSLSVPDVSPNAVFFEEDKNNAHSADLMFMAVGSFVD